MGGGASRAAGGRGDRPSGGRGDRPSAGPESRGRERGPEPELPEAAEAGLLDTAARSRLRTLSKVNGDVVARHLVAAGLFLDDDPERAYAHAQAALGRAGRVDVVHEAVALTAYATERYAEALRELRTVRRLSGVDAHRAMEADCERGLGRPERALALASGPEAADLPEEQRVELAIVASGARLDLADPEAALVVLDTPPASTTADPTLRRRVAQARALAWEALGRPDRAREVLAAEGADEEAEEAILVLDLAEEEDGDD